MMKTLYVIATLFLVIMVTTLTGCSPKKEVSGSFDFVIYESDDDNSDLSDNVVVARYHIEYVDCKTVTDTLIKKEDHYYFTEKSNDYLILVDTAYGLSYTKGYFENYSECSGGNAIDVSWSYTAVNGTSATTGIGETPLEGLLEFGFVINGWK